MTEFPPAAPVEGTHVPSTDQIIWNWDGVTGATGYKWNTEDDYGTASDMGTSTTHTESGLTCNTEYSRYVWAYNNTGHSSSTSLYQYTLNCWTCGDSSIIIHHTAGAVAPVTKTVTYGTATNIPGETSKCWITSNLGADRQALAVDDTTESSAGWYWQFNRMQGFKHNGLTRTPNTTWIPTIFEDVGWLQANDPCFLELGSGWRLPTSNEWSNIKAAGNWANWNGPWNSGLRIHAAGLLNDVDGTLISRTGGDGSVGCYWSRTYQNIMDGYYLSLGINWCGISLFNKSFATPLRCVKE